MQDLFKEVGQVVIAGGSVRDALMGKPYKDIDAFILSSSGEKWRVLADRAKEKLASYQSIKPIVEWHKSEPYLIDSIKHKFGEVQVMLRLVRNVDELLDTFDWNVSLFAITESGVVQREDVANIAPRKELWCQRVTYPRSTLRRGFRFSERFKMRFRDGVIESICAEVAKQHEERQAKKGGAS
jgi:hypothetical protein